MIGRAIKHNATLRQADVGELPCRSSGAGTTLPVRRMSESEAAQPFGPIGLPAVCRQKGLEAGH